MTVRGVGVTDQASGAGVADVRTRERSVDGGTYAEQYVIPISERVASYKGFLSTFRTPGRAAVTQNLFSIYNTSASVLVAVRRTTIQIDSAAVLNVSWANLFTTYRVTVAPTNGTTLGKNPFDSALTSDAGVVHRGDASADGTVSASALTATLTTPAWRQFASRIHTAVGQMLVPDDGLVPNLAEDDPIILRQNQGLVVALNANATAANGATVMYLVNHMWEEFTLP